MSGIETHTGDCRDVLANPEWVHDCLKWRGKVLTGKKAHWCEEWDCLPVDETTQEWPCLCFADEEPQP